MRIFRRHEAGAFIVLSLCLALLLLPALISCGKKEEPVHVDFSKREKIDFREDPSTITYAYLPQYSHRVSYERHHPLVEYLKHETGLPIRQIFPDTFDDYIKMFGQGKIDISFSNPFTYIKVAHRFGARAFARIVETNGKEYFRGQIICRNDNKAIQTLEDCRGKRWVAVDPSSAGGYLFALGHFWDHGIRKEDFAEIAFVPGPGGQQEKVVLAVYAGRYDIGSIREGSLEVAAEKIDISQIRVLASTAWYPGWMFLARGSLDPGILAAVRKAMLKLDCTNPEQKAICDAAHFAGILSAEDSDFEPLRQLATKVGIDLNQ